jgi:transaldolase
MATALEVLCREYGQSPWLDNLTRGYITSGRLAQFIDSGIRGVTANPSIFAKAIEGSTDYDEAFRDLLRRGHTVEDAYWTLVIDDVLDAARVLRPVHEASDGDDGFVSIEVAPELARDTGGTIDAACRLHDRIAEPNVYVKIPATAEGVPAVEEAVARGHNINVTLIFSLRRYRQVIHAYESGLERLVAAGGDPARVRGVASFFVSRVDTEVDRRLTAIGTPAATGLRGRAAVAQAKLAYRIFRTELGTDRWATLAAKGARPQRPLWASTSTKNPEYPDTLYVDNLIGPDTVTTLPETTITAFEDHGAPARTVDRDVDGAEEVMVRLGEIGIDMEDVGLTLEAQGVDAFHESFAHVLHSLHDKAPQVAGP